MEKIKLGSKVRTKKEIIQNDLKGITKIPKGSEGVVCDIDKLNEGVVFVEMDNENISDIPVFSFSIDELEIIN